jgi:hypothetical protein
MFYNTVSIFLDYEIEYVFCTVNRSTIWPNIALDVRMHTFVDLFTFNFFEKALLKIKRKELPKY